MYDWDTMLTDYDAKEGERINRTLLGPPDYDTLAYLRGRASRSTWARINETLAPKPSTLNRICEAIDSPKALAFYLGFFAGCFATVLTAIIWGTLL
jgi:hypothetical protein